MPGIGVEHTNACTVNLQWLNVRIKRNWSWM